MADITDMGKKVYATFSSLSQPSESGWDCSVCHKNNLSLACFCGECGTKRPVTKKLKQTSGFGFEKLHSFAESIKDSFKNVSGNGKKIKHQNKVSVLAISVFVFFIVTIFLLKTISAEQSHAKAVEWAKMRIYLANRFNFSPADLDSALNTSCQIIPSPDATIGVDQLIKVESCLKSKTGIKSLTFFPNPYFELTVDANGRKVFQDLPLDHPAYVALKPIFDLGISCEAGKNVLAPYQKMYWDDWNNIKKQFFTILALETELESPDKADRKGPMSNYELSESIGFFRKSLGMKATKTQLWSGEFCYPSRLEALSAIAQLISEIEG